MFALKQKQPVQPAPRYDDTRDREIEARARDVVAAYNNGKGWVAIREAIRKLDTCINR